MPDPVVDFKLHKYIKVEGLITKELAAIATIYAKAMETYHFKDGDFLAPKSHSNKDDFLMESMLALVRPRIEQFTGLSLSPTYSYYRVYKAGEKLIEHTDRNACEVSVTLCLGYDYLGKDYKWTIAMGDKKVAMEPGDGVIYRGIELRHSRPPLEIEDGGWHAQVFLHYIDNNGPYADYIFDGRKGLFEKWDPQKEKQSN